MKVLNILFLVFIIGLLFTYTKAEEADWRLWYQNSDGLSFYYDAESITHPSKDIVRVLGKIEGSEVVSMNKDTNKIEKREKAKKVPCLFEFNCSLRMYRMLSSTIEYEDGRVEKKDNPDAEWIHILPESFFEPFYNAVCP